MNTAHRRAFSLVETALALGVVAFALTALVALLPGGLTHFRGAMDTSLGAQIFQRVVTDVEQMEFDSLLAAGAGTAGDFFALPTRFFDEQGDEVSAAESAKIVYQARVRVSPPGPATASGAAPGITALPAASGDEPFSPRDAVFLTIQVAHNPQRAEWPVDVSALWVRPPAQAASSMLTYSAVITRTGRASTAPAR